MDLQADGRIGFIYEETLTGFGKRNNPVSTSFPTGAGQHNFDGFDNIYVAYPLDYITGGAYSINAISTNIGKSEIKNQKSELTFDLTGRRITNPSKGLYIVGGKKSIIK